MAKVTTLGVDIGILAGAVLFLALMLAQHPDASVELASAGCGVIENTVGRAGVQRIPRFPEEESVVLAGEVELFCLLKSVVGQHAALDSDKKVMGSAVQLGARGFSATPSVRP